MVEKWLKEGVGEGLRRGDAGEIECGGGGLQAASAGAAECLEAGLGFGDALGEVGGVFTAARKVILLLGNLFCELLREKGESEGEELGQGQVCASSWTFLSPFNKAAVSICRRVRSSRLPAP